MDQVFPGVPRKESLDGFETLLSIDAARQHLGFEPQHRWQNTVGKTAQNWADEAAEILSGGGPGPSSSVVRT